MNENGEEEHTGEPLTWCTRYTGSKGGRVSYSHFGDRGQRLVADGGQSEADRHAEIMNTPIAERPETEQMSVDELRAEYKTFDVAALSSVEDEERWERHLELWRELESREIVEFPECARDTCDSRRWRFEAGGPAHCAECGEPVADAEHSREVQAVAERLIHGGESA